MTSYAPDSKRYYCLQVVTEQQAESFLSNGWYSSLNAPPKKIHARISNDAIKRMVSRRVRKYPRISFPQKLCGGRELERRRHRGLSTVVQLSCQSPQSCQAHPHACPGNKNITVQVLYSLGHEWAQMHYLLAVEQPVWAPACTQPAEINFSLSIAGWPQCTCYPANNMPEVASEKWWALKGFSKGTLWQNVQGYV